MCAFIDSLTSLPLSFKCAAQELDLNPCGGTHLQSLSELQLLKVTEPEDGCRHFLAVTLRPL